MKNIKHMWTRAARVESNCAELSSGSGLLQPLSLQIPGVPLTGVLETGVFARLDKCLTGMRKPWMPEHKFSHERKAHFHDSENPCLQNPC